MPTVLITGASAGLGHAVATLFQARGWNVAATMRTPEKEQALGQLERVALIPLDVTDEASIQAAFEAAVARVGAIDGVSNNAGYGLTGPFETLEPAQIRRQFETNVLGLMAVCRAAIPRFRAQQGGTIVNIASMGGRITFPLYSVYHSTKWAVEGFSESLQHELRPFGIRVKLVEPGVIRTDFYGRSADASQADAGSPYADYARKVLTNMTPGEQSGSSAAQVAEVVFRAATDGSAKLRYPAGSDAKQILWLRKLTPDWLYTRIVRGIVEA